MAVAIFLGCCMSQHEDSSSVTTSIKVLKDINSIKPPYVEVWEYLCNRISSNVCSSIHRNLKLARIIFSYTKHCLFHKCLTTLQYLTTFKSVNFFYLKNFTSCDIPQEMLNFKKVNLFLYVEVLKFRVPNWMFMEIFLSNI